MDFKRYFFIVFMWQMYLIYLRKALILVSGLGIFLRVLGRGGAIFMCLFFNCCFLAEPLQCGIPLGTGRPGAPSRPFFPRQYSVFPLFHGRNLAKQTPFFPSSFCRAQLFSEPSAPLPNPIAVRSSQAGAGGPAARDGHPGLEQPIFVWKCTVVQCYRCNFDLQC